MAKNLTPEQVAEAIEKFSTETDSIKGENRINFGR